MEHTQGKIIGRKPSPKIWLAVLLLAASVLSGCRNPLNGSVPGEPAMGTFLLTIDGRGSSRTIAPDWPGDDNVRFRLSFTSAQHPDAPVVVEGWIPGGPGDSGVALLAGTWTLTVTVYPRNGNTAGRIAIGTYSPINVTPGGVVSGTVPLNPITDAGPGTFSWNISSDITVTDTHLRITRVGETDPVHNQSHGVSGLSGSISTLLPGTYNVVFTLGVDGRENAVMREVLRIYSNMTSEFRETLGDLHFPTTLLNIILNAINNPTPTIRASAYGAGVRAGHFGLLDIQGLYGIGDFQGFLGWFDTLAAGPNAAGPVPEDRDELVTLVDAALVGLGASAFVNATHSVGRRQNTQNAIMGMVRNGTAVTLTWSSSTRLDANVGGYAFAIDFAHPVFDFTVTYNANGGSATPNPASFLVYAGQVVDLPGAPGERGDYEFIGWNTQANGGGRLFPAPARYSVTGDVTLFATWIQIPLVEDGTSAPTFRVTLDPNPGTPVPLPPVLYGTEIMLPTHTRTGYVLRGWSGVGVGLIPAGAPFIVTEDITLRADWVRIPDGDVTVATHTLTLLPGTGGIGSPIVMTVVGGSQITLPPGGFTRPWHDLTHWDGDSDRHPVNTAITVNEDEELSAVWYRPRVTVYFDLNPGGVHAPFTRNVDRGSIIMLPVYSRLPADIFLGWNTRADGDDGVHLGLAPYLATENITLYARWVPFTPATYTVTYAPNGGVRDVADPADGAGDTFQSAAVPSGTIIRLPNGGFRRDNHTFIGWRDTPASEGPVHIGNSPFAVPAGGITLYAAWLPIPPGQSPAPTYRVTLHPNGGEGLPIALMEVPAGTTISLPDPGFSMAHYGLSGWNTRADGHGTSVGLNSVTVNGDLTLYAVWQTATVTSVTVSPATVTLRSGESQAFTATVAGTNNPPQGVTWAIVDGTTGNVIEPAGIILTAHGSFAVTPAAAHGNFTVRATSNHDDTTFGTATVTVEYEVTGVTIMTDVSAAFERGSTPRFTAVVSGPNHPPQDVRWYVFEDDPDFPEELHGGTSIDALGELNIPSGEGNSHLRVRAVSVSDPSWFDDAYIELTGDVVRGDWWRVRVGIDHTMAITWNGELYAWGQNLGGQIGQGTNNMNNTGGAPRVVNYPSPMRVGNERDWLYVSGGWSHTMALRGNRATNPPTGHIYVWGRMMRSFDTAGTPVVDVFGDTPTRITNPSYTDWVSIVAGHSHSFAIRDNGDLYAWGWNENNRLGIQGLEIDNEVPFPRLVDGISNVASVSSSRTHTVALTDEGYMYVWGNSTHGQLGPGGGSATPRRLGLVPDDEGVYRQMRWNEAIAGYHFTVAICEDGFMYSWGNGANGRLGNGGTASRTTPARISAPLVPGTTDQFQPELRWHSVHLNQTTHVIAIDADRRLWAWGANNHRQIGDPNVGLNVNTTRPILITPGGHTRWISSIAGGSFSLAIQVDGELWAWGHNSHGMLGTGTTAATVPTPTRIHRTAPSP